MPIFRRDSVGEEAAQTREGTATVRIERFEASCAHQGCGNTVGYRAVREVVHAPMGDDEPLFPGETPDSLYEWHQIV